MALGTFVRRGLRQGLAAIRSRSRPAQIARASYSRQGFTLLELLVVVAIVTVLAGVVFPAMSRAKIASYNAGHMAALRNIAVARSLYLDSHDAEPYNTRKLVATGMDRQLLASPLDPFENGAANVYRLQLGDHPEWATSYKDSVFCIDDKVGEMLFDDVKESQGGGWAVFQAEPPDSSDQAHGGFFRSFEATAVYAKRFIRLTFDGSAVFRPVVWRKDKGGEYFTSSMWYFTDEHDLWLPPDRS